MIFEGLAEWQPALPLCEIRGHGYRQVTSAALFSSVGLRVVRDVTLAPVDLA